MSLLCLMVVNLNSDSNGFNGLLDMDELKSLALECFDPAFTDKVHIREKIEMVEGKAIVTTERKKIETTTSSILLFNPDGSPALDKNGTQRTHLKTEKTVDIN